MSSPVLMSPSVLNADLTRLREEVERIAAVSDLIHLDVMDGHFVPNLTFGLTVIEPLLRDERFRSDCHLMIDDPDRWAPEYARAGAYSVTFHIEAARDAAQLCSDLRSHGARAGVAVKPGSNLDEIAALGDSVDMILVMTVEPGFGGQAFRDDMLPKIRRARELASRSDGDVWVQVDGGIGAETIERCAEAGANVFVAGSAVFRSDDPQATIENLRAVAERRHA
ncbi:MAG: ribulose-phosphate 3-epimerase [Actinobacteria bacterium]|nr:ribulose-phosphate 3-epimerase [Actinomycetota bacterium]